MSGIVIIAALNSATGRKRGGPLNSIVPVVIPMFSVLLFILFTKIKIKNPLRADKSATQLTYHKATLVLVLLQITVSKVGFRLRLAWISLLLLHQVLLKSRLSVQP
jgi:hypothetical protein